MFEGPGRTLEEHLECLRLQEEMIQFFDVYARQVEVNESPGKAKDIQISANTCFENAYMIASALNCKYVEGYFEQEDGQQIHHAWNLYRGRHFDRTAEEFYNSKPTSYIALIALNPKEISKIPCTDNWHPENHGGTFMPILSRIYYHQSKILVPR